MSKANEIRKTSLGMQAIGVAPHDLPRGELRRDDRRAHALGASVTLVLHLAIVGTIVFMNEIDRGHTQKIEAEPQAIEAGLAIKKKAQEGKKSALPQKEVAAKVKPPDVEGVAHNANQVPPEKKPEKKRDVAPPEATDATSVFDKYRHVDTGATSGGEHSDTNQQGDENGSEFGTLEKAKGDPYVGELIGRMTKDFVVPTLVTDTSLKTWGCVKLDENGKIVDREIDKEHKSRSHAFNSAVEERLKEATDMDKPVPSHLKHLLVEQGACATYTSQRE
jgi:hypothetical protein